MSNYLIERTTDSKTVTIACRNMREANLVFENAKDHILTDETRMIVYGKIVQSHISAKKKLGPLMDLDSAQ